MINLKDWNKWNGSLSEEEVVRVYDKFGCTSQVPEIVHFGFNKVRDNLSISPVSGNFRKTPLEDYFEGHAISIMGNSYLEGILDKEKGILKMIEFYEVLHSRGDWCEYNLDLNKKGKEKGEYLHVRQGKDFDMGKIEIISLENFFSLDKGIDEISHFHVVYGGMQPKRLTKFWNDLKEEGFNVPQGYYPEDEIKDFHKPEDDLPF
jgi:hypothetical protein